MMKRACEVLIGIVLIMCLTACLATAHAEGMAEATGAPGLETAAPGLETAAPVGGKTPAAAIDLTPLMQAVVSLAVTLITAFLIPWIRTKYSCEQQQRIAAVYQTIVYAAEQMFGAGTGERKLEWAIEQLGAKGFLVDRAVIEAEVRKMGSLGAEMLADGRKGSGTGIGTGG